MKKPLILFAILILIGGVFAWYQYSKPAEREVGTTADHDESAESLFDSFNADEAAANTKFLGKVVRLSGVVAEVDGTTIALATGDAMGRVTCEFAEGEAVADVRVGQEYLFMGQCDGFTGFDVQLSKCRLVAR